LDGRVNFRSAIAGLGRRCLSVLARPRWMVAVRVGYVVQLTTAASPLDRVAVPCNVLLLTDVMVPLSPLR
jgi:hypothetical protein